MGHFMIFEPDFDTFAYGRPGGNVLSEASTKMTFAGDLSRDFTVQPAIETLIQSAFPE